MARPDRPCGLGCNRSTCGPTVCHGRIPWDELPCREFCNHYGSGTTCFIGRCGSPYRRDDPRFWLGRGSEDVPGRSAGWAHNMERQAIRDHLKAKGRWNDATDEFEVIRIQHRIQRDYHRRKPPIGVRRRGPAPAPPPEDFTADELAMIAERFAGANDPLGQSIHAKAMARGSERDVEQS